MVGVGGEEYTGNGGVVGLERGQGGDGCVLIGGGGSGDVGRGKVGGGG